MNDTHEPNDQIMPSENSSEPDHVLELATWLDFYRSAISDAPSETQKRFHTDRLRNMVDVLDQGVTELLHQVDGPTGQRTANLFVLAMAMAAMMESALGIKETRVATSVIDGGRRASAATNAQAHANSVVKIAHWQMMADRMYAADPTMKFSQICLNIETRCRDTQFHGLFRYIKKVVSNPKK